MKINWKNLIFYLAVTLGTGAFASFLTRNSMEIYDVVEKPALAPSPILFPIVWSVLYVIMAIGAYIISEKNCENKEASLSIYYIQLAFNFFWPIVFFNLQAFLFSFIWIIALWILIILMILSFRKCSKWAAYLQLPYLIWVTFAAYLNLMIWLLNR